MPVDILIGWLLFTFLGWDIFHNITKTDFFFFSKDEIDRQYYNKCQAETLAMIVRDHIIGDISC